MKFILQIISLLFLFINTIQAQENQKILVTSEKIKIPERLMFAFQSGDKVLLNIHSNSRKAKNELMVYTYPDEKIIYQNSEFKDLVDLEIKVEKQGIYIFDLGSNSMINGNKEVELNISRKPSDPLTADFNTKVTSRSEYSVVTILKTQKFYVNSSTNLGGNTRISVPFKLPKNTIKWYYQFMASSNEDQIDQGVYGMDLESELKYQLKEKGLNNLDAFLPQPNGNMYCSIYLMDNQNNSLFLSKNEYMYLADASRENFKAGTVESDCCLDVPLLYLGIKNPDMFEGIHVALSIAAITETINYEIVE
jgi:hypothetical protein